MQGFAFDPSKMSKVAAEEYSSSESDGDDEDEYLMPSTDPRANEFADHNPRKRRRTGRDTKESAALGIFGSESEDDGPSRPWKRKTLRSKGVSFVSSEKQEQGSARESGDDDDDDGLNTMKARVADEEDKDEDEDEDEDDEAGAVGLGFHVAAGPAPPSTQRQLFPGAAVAPQKARPRPAFDRDNPLGRGFVPSSANEPVVLVTEDVEPRPQIPARPSAFSAKSAKNGKAKLNPNSFGARMMAKMGYVEGKGLGKEGQGRHVLVEPNIRPQGVGLGAVKEKSEKERQEEKRQARLRGEVVVDSDDEEKKKKAARRKRATAYRTGSGEPSSGASTPRRQKPKYMTMDEVRKAAPGLNIPDAFTPILDMTGPGRKMLTSSSGLMTPTGGPAAETAEHAESRKLARRAQNDFMAILEEWQSLQNRKAYVELTMQQERQQLGELEIGLQNHQTMMSSFAELSLLDSSEPWETRWARTLSQLRSAAETIPQESAGALKDELVEITVAALHPVFKEALQLWDPLKDPNPPMAGDLRSIAAFSACKSLQSNTGGRRPRLTRL